MVGFLERFFVVRVGEATLDAANRTEEECTAITAHRWWSLAEIAAGGAVFVPRRLPGLLPPLIAGVYPPAPIEAGD